VENEGELLLKMRVMREKREGWIEQLEKGRGGREFVRE
jgi:hypothetical protein